MQIIEEGEQAFYKKIDCYSRIRSIRKEDQLMLFRAKEKIQNGENWRETLMDLLVKMNAEAMALKLSPGLREFYSLLYNNREEIESLERNIKGSMTMLMIFD